MDELQPTIIGQPSELPVSDNSLGVSKAHVGFVAGDRPNFSNETAGLLHRRLSAAAGVIAVTLGAAFVGNYLNGISSQWWLRAFTLLIAVGSTVILHRITLLSLSKLRLLEIVLFGSLVMQLALILVTRVSEFAATNDATSLVSAEQQVMAAFCIVIFIYGTLVPNTWRRGAAVMLPVAMLPYLLIQIQCRLSPEISALLSANKSSTALPLPVVAACVATYGTHVINSVRRDAFKARQFGQYRLMDRLGAGGMGEVYKAEHVLLKRPCAIKLITTSRERDAAAIARFEKEVKATARLSHWNSIEIFDYGRTDDGTFYYVMELLPGLSLDDILTRYGSLPPERVVHLMRQICGALQEAHGVGLIHRDIKPGNIFAAQRGGLYDVAKLLDFGLVKEQSKTPHAQSSTVGTFSGTPMYMPPEQASAFEDVDGRADIYSLGAVAYHLLTGRPPFSGKNVVELLSAHANTIVPRPSSLNSAIPADLEAIILKCMAKDPDDRFPHVDALGLALEQCSMADQWKSEQAADWWRSRDSRPPANKTLNPTDDATVMYQR